MSNPQLIRSTMETALAGVSPSLIADGILTYAGLNDYAAATSRITDLSNAAAALTAAISALPVGRPHDVAVDQSLGGYSRYVQEFYQRVITVTDRSAAVAAIGRVVSTLQAVATAIGPFAPVPGPSLLDNITVTIASLPTTPPDKSGVLWNDGGIVSLS